MIRSVEPIRRDERGVVAGLDGLLFGTLVLLGGVVLVVNAWAVLDTRLALDGAAREYLRAYGEAPDATTAAAAGGGAADRVLQGRSFSRHVRIEAPDASHFGPCSVAVVELSATVPSARIPFVGEFGTTVVTVRHSELVDAHQEVIPGDRFDASDTPCS